MLERLKDALFGRQILGSITTAEAIACVVAAVLSLTVLLSIFPIMGLLWKATH